MAEKKVVTPVKDDGLHEFIKPNGTLVRINEHAIQYALDLDWLPRADYEKLLAEQAKADKEAKKPAPKGKANK